MLTAEIGTGPQAHLRSDATDRVWWLVNQPTVLNKMNDLNGKYIHQKKLRINKPVLVNSISIFSYALSRVDEYTFVVNKTS